MVKDVCHYRISFPKESYLGDTLEVKVTSLSSKAELYIGVGTNISTATNFASYSSGHLVRVYKPEEVFINVYATGFIGGSFRVTY